MNKKYNFKLLFLVVIVGFSSSVLSTYRDTNTVKKIKYKTSFGRCPSRTAGQMAMRLIKNFEKNKSLKKLKALIVDEDLAQGHFISDYKIKYNPIKKSLNFKFVCPKPLMKVQVYKKNGLDSYEAILVENGELYDPTYEVLLRGDNKIAFDLPFLALPLGELDKGTKKHITRIVNGAGDQFRRKISEVILDDKGEMTVILSLLDGNPSSVFMGRDNWDEKMLKLKKIIKNMESNRRIPAIINLTNAKKVVVKFNSSI